MDAMDGLVVPTRVNGVTTQVIELNQFKYNKGCGISDVSEATLKIALTRYIQRQKRKAYHYLLCIEDNKNNKWKRKRQKRKMTTYSNKTRRFGLRQCVLNDVDYFKSLLINDPVLRSDDNGLYELDCFVFNSHDSRGRTLISCNDTDCLLSLIVYSDGRLFTNPTKRSNSAITNSTCLASVNIFNRMLFCLCLICVKSDYDAYCKIPKFGIESFKNAREMILNLTHPDTFKLDYSISLQRFRDTSDNIHTAKKLSLTDRGIRSLTESAALLFNKFRHISHNKSHLRIQLQNAVAVLLFYCGNNDSLLRLKECNNVQE